MQCLFLKPRELDCISCIQTRSNCQLRIRLQSQNGISASFCLSVDYFKMITKIYGPVYYVGDTSKLIQVRLLLYAKLYVYQNTFIAIGRHGASFQHVFFCVLAVTLKVHHSAFHFEQFVFVVSDGVLPQVLYEVNLPILNSMECSRALSTLRKPIQGDTILCAGFPDGGKDACQVS